jgi:ribonuclease P protein component
VVFLQIKKSAEFKNIGHKGQKFSSHTISLLAKETPTKYLYDAANGKNAKEFCRIGYTVSKAIGGAVARNLAKRRLRVAFKKLFLKYNKNHFDYIIIARKDIAKANFSKILQDLEFCFRNIHGREKK